MCRSASSRSRRRTSCLVSRRDQSSELRIRPVMSESPRIMPPFTCPRCGKDYVVPLAYCEAFLDDTPVQTRGGWESVYTLPCPDCTTQIHNLLSALPADLPEELVETLVANKHIRIER